MHKYNKRIYKTRQGNQYIKKLGVIIWNDITNDAKNNYTLGMLKRIVREELLLKY